MPKPDELTGLEHLLDFVSHLFGSVKAVHDFPVTRLRSVVLLHQNGLTASSLAHIVKQRIMLEVFECVRWNPGGSHRDLAIRADFVTVQAAPAGHVLILLADGVTGQFDFDSACLLSSGPGGH